MWLNCSKTALKCDCESCEFVKALNISSTDTANMEMRRANNSCKSFMEGWRVGQHGPNSQRTPAAGVKTTFLGVGPPCCRYQLGPQYIFYHKMLTSVLNTPTRLHQRDLHESNLSVFDSQVSEALWGRTYWGPISGEKGTWRRDTLKITPHLFRLSSWCVPSTSLDPRVWCSGTWFMFWFWLHRTIRTR